MSITLNDISKKVMLFAAVVGATGIVAGASVLAQSQQSAGNNGKGNSYSSNQCKNGGWEELGYKNQGQCVSNMVKVNISNSTSQSAQSGNASVNGNTNGGNAQSGSASNSNSSSTSVQVTN